MPAGSSFAGVVIDIDGEGTTAFSGDGTIDVGLSPNPGAKTFDMRRHDKPHSMRRHDKPFEMKRG
jgi:hypothetical protein